MYGLLAEEPDEGEGEEVITRIRGRDFDDAEENTFHTAKDGISMLIDDYLDSKERRREDITTVVGFSLLLRSVVWVLEG